MFYRQPSLLRRYLQDCILPLPLYEDVDIVPDGTRKHENGIDIRPEQYRILSKIAKFDSDRLVEVAHSWLELYCHRGLPKPDLKKFRIPTRPDSSIRKEGADIYFEPITPVTGWRDLKSQLVTATFKTLEEVMKLIVPHPSGGKLTWRIHTPEAVSQEFANENGLFDFCFWSDPSSSPYGVSGQTAQDDTRKGMLVVYQPPWVLAAQNLRDFCDCTEFPAFAQFARLPSRNRLWGRIWDLCVRFRVQFFVLTSIEQWAFGAFAADLESAWISDAIPCDSRDPTIAEMLTYWAGISMGLDQHSLVKATNLHRPEIIDNKEIVFNAPEAPQISIPVPEHHVGLIRWRSESPFEESEEFSAGVSDRGISPACSVDSDRIGPPMRTRSVTRAKFAKRDGVQVWNEETSKALSVIEELSEYAPSDASSSATVLGKDRMRTPSVASFSENASDTTEVPPKEHDRSRTPTPTPQLYLGVVDTNKENCGNWVP